MAPHRDFGVAIKVASSRGATREPVAARNPAILYGIGNILKMLPIRYRRSSECMVEC